MSPISTILMSCRIFQFHEVADIRRVSLDISLLNRFDDSSFYFFSEIKSNSFLSDFRNDFEFFYII